MGWEKLSSPRPPKMPGPALPPKFKTTLLAVLEVAHNLLIITRPTTCSIELCFCGRFSFAGLLSCKFQVLQGFLFSEVISQSAICIARWGRSRRGRGRSAVGGSSSRPSWGMSWALRWTGPTRQAPSRKRSRRLSTFPQSNSTWSVVT